MFNVVSIIGCGLIGSSILKSIQNKNLAKEVRIFDLSKEVTAYLKKENICSNISTDIRQCVKDSDLIIVATPLSSYKEIILSIKDDLKKGAILTDTGSVKKEVMKIIHNMNLKDINWIPSHPIAEQKKVAQRQEVQICLKIAGVSFLHQKIVLKNQ